MHYIMENVDFRRNDISQQVRNLSAGLKEGDILKICAFFDGPLGARLKKADKVYREAPFTFGVPANSLDESFPESEAAIVQGTIDCFFEEDGKLVLIDYKTDRYAHPDEIRRRYQKQIDLYALALEKKYLKKVSEKYIYLFEKCDILSM